LNQEDNSKFNAVENKISIWLDSSILKLP